VVSKDWRKFVVGFDFHGDKHDPKTKQVFLDFVDRWRPDIRIFGGDLWDFRPLRKGASNDEREQSMKEDFVAGMQFLKEFGPHHYLRGNHCERLWELAGSGKGVEADYAQHGIGVVEQELRNLKCSMLPYDKRRGVLQLGHLRVIHGFWSGMHADKQAALVYGAVLQGHVHTVSEFAIPGLERRVARSCGALCQLDFDYNARTPSSLRHANGFAYGVLNIKTGLYHVWQAESIGDVWMLPSDTVQIG
jgi:hypothetical protein